MTLARNGTRQIIVGGVRYRWTVTFEHQRVAGIVVELSESPRSRLRSLFDIGVGVGPGLVRRAVLDALEAGWRPNEPGPDFVRRVPEFSESLTASHQCPVCDYFSLPTRGQYEVCPVCFWEDDGLDLDEIDVVSGPNHLTLREARANFLVLGASDSAAREHVLDEQSRQRFRRAPRQPNGSA